MWTQQVVFTEVFDFIPRFSPAGRNNLSTGAREGRLKFHLEKIIHTLSIFMCEQNLFKKIARLQTFSSTSNSQTFWTGNSFNRSRNLVWHKCLQRNSFEWNPSVNENLNPIWICKPLKAQLQKLEKRFIAFIIFLRCKHHHSMRRLHLWNT